MDCWWEFAVGVKAVAAAVGKELGQGLVGIFGARGLSHHGVENETVAFFLGLAILCSQDARIF